MFIHALKNDGGLVVEGSGLGLFDAFFASLSMIMVSEVGFCSSTKPSNLALAFVGSLFYVGFAFLDWR